MTQLRAICFDFGDTLADEATEEKDAAGVTLRAELIPGAAELIHTLKQRGYTLALVADGYPGTYRNVLTQHALYDCFDVFAISEEVGVVKPDEGGVKFEQKEISHLAMHQRARLGIGYLTQEPSVFRKLTVEQNLLAILETCKMNRQERQVRLKYLLDELDLTPLARNMAYTLSGGEKRRLEITRALVTSPKLLLLDEPFAGIDPIAVYEVQKIVRRLKERGLGILITDHGVREMLKLIDRGYIIVKGEVACQGTAEFLANDPKAREIYLGPEFTM